MSLITSLTEFAKVCSKQPLSLVDEAEKEKYVAELKKIANVLSDKMGDEEYKGTKAEKSVQELAAVLSSESLDEHVLSKALVDIYIVVAGDSPRSLRNELAEFKKYLDIFNYRALHHKVRTEDVSKECQLLNPEERKLHDQKVLREKLFFYVLEYTLQVAVELKRVSPEQQIQLLDIGLNVEAGNLPGLRPLLESFREEVVYSICDAEERDHILEVFLEFEGVVNSNDMQSIIVGLDKFNKDLLQVAVKFGITHYNGIIYKSYADNTPLESIIASL